MEKRIISLLAALCIALGCLAGCSGNTDNPQVTTEGPATHVDYVGQLDLDLASETLKQEVTVKAFVDGDTTHFYVPTSVSPSGVLKARYLAVNTPESTGKIEEWGKKASNFTREKLENATSIMIESDDGNWNVDSTGERHLVWVWYKPEGEVFYRNLNIELLQNGLSVASNSAENRYGELCMDAIAQAKAEKLHIHSKEDDPDFYYGDAIPVTLKGLRSNLELYHNMKVAFEGVITYEDGQTVYVEEYDAETDMYYGITVYYGFNLTGTGLEILEPGNRVAFVGSVQYYETGGTWQVSDIKYVDMRPDDPNNIQLISSGHQASNRLTDPTVFYTSTLDLEVMKDLAGEEVEMQTFGYAQAAMSTSVEMKNLRVVSISTTKNEESDNNGAMTLTCQAPNGQNVAVRTVVLYDENGEKITEDAYKGKTIDVKGIVDYFSGRYQIKVFAPEDITVVS